MNISDIKSNYKIEDVIAQHISLKKQGPELVGNCPFHKDEHASLKVNPTKQIFKCFACDAGGDMFDFFTLQGQSFKEAANSITNGTILTPQEHAPKPPVVEWKNAVPDQTKLPDVANLVFKDYGKPAMFWAYHDTTGNIIGYVLRFNLPDGKKDVIPYTYKNNGTESKWVWKGFDLLRPLYNLHELNERPDAVVIMVEGEKAADAAKRLFPRHVATTWIGGGENVKNADLSPLKGRRILLWADNDLPGIRCMFGGWVKNDKTGEYRRVKGITDILEAEFKRVQNSPDFPKKWDIADADWTIEEAAEYLKNNKTEIPTVSAYPPNELPPAAPIPEIPELPPTIPIIPETPELAEKPIQEKNPYFKCLGFETSEGKNEYVFYVYRTNVVIKLSAGGISVSNLLQLAPLNYWEGAYPKKSRSSSGPKFEINVVADNLITICSKIGMFNPNKIRGRGAWIDNGIPIIHCGDHLIVNGKKTEFSKHKSKFIYEAGQELGFNLVTPLVKSEAFKIIQLLERLNWARDINARLFAGWVVVAPLCGALGWRPHLWLTGASGSGKSEVMKLFTKKLLGEMFVDAQSETTEAGIRQFLRADALPVVFDEAESETKRDFERVQSVLNLMRASSTSDGGKIIKGSSGGSAAQFNIRSCFAFASIGANLTQRSDISRITVLELKTDESEDKREKWKKFLQDYYKIVNDEYIQAFQSRSVSLLSVILQNAKTFSNAAAAELDNQRTGDQLGALLAGAYSLTSDSLISFEDAKKWINQRDWSEERLVESTRDEIKVLHKIVNAECTVETMAGKITRTVGELIMIGRGDVVDASEAMIIPEELARVTLKRLGIRVESYCVLISDSSDFISRALSNTAYPKNYPSILSRIEGATKVDRTTFGSFIEVRATKIDTRQIFGDLENPGISEAEKNIYR